MRLLVFNAGSSSLKFDLLEVSATAPPQRVMAGAYVDAADGSGRFVPRVPESESKSKPGSSQFLAAAYSLADAADSVLRWLADPVIQGQDLLSGLVATVHRVVHGGVHFRATTRLQDPEIAALTDLGPLAPLHNPPALAVISAVRRRLGTTVPAIGVFDTAYYADLPEVAYRYAVPARWLTEFSVRRYGFHGLAHRYLYQRACARLRLSPSNARVVSLQLGRGCSVTATTRGRAIATSMGFTPLEGLVMGTRSGDIDPGAVLYVMERSGMSAADMRRELNEKSGLLGLSGQSADMRELLTKESGGDAPAALAIEIFCRRARYYLAAYIAELGGVDGVVFGGGIGENSPEIRRRILRGLEWGGIEVDSSVNAAAISVESSIGTSASRCAILVIPVDEASVIASEALALLSPNADPNVGRQSDK